MKIEKLTENKIRVILYSKDLDISALDMNTIMQKKDKTQELLFDILDKAEKEVDFQTKGAKLLIEASASIDDVLVFTITKYPNKDKTTSNSLSKRIIIKKKNVQAKTKLTCYTFDTFDTFCDFCDILGKKSHFDIDLFTKHSSLFLYQDTYYLMIKNVKQDYMFKKTFYSVISEFANPATFSTTFEHKLLEYGKPVMKRNAIHRGITLFSK